MCETRSAVRERGHRRGYFRLKSLRRVDKDELGVLEGSDL
jgi:hypothetical protein